MLATFFLLLMVTVSGLLLTYIYLDEATPFVRLVGGATTGLLLFAVIGYGYACVLTLTPLTMTLVVLTMLLPCLVLRSPRHVEQMRREWLGPIGPYGGRRQVVLVAIASLVVGMMAVASFSNDCYMKTVDKADSPSIFTADGHNLSDLTMHMGIVASLLWGRNYPTEDIEYETPKHFGYTFLPDFETAELMVGGGGLVSVITVHELFMGLLLVAALGMWSFEFLPDRRAAFLTIVLVLLNGGVGAVDLFNNSGGTLVSFLNQLANLPQDYTINEHTLRFGNSLTCLFMPQRPLLMGMPELLWVLLLLWRAIRVEPGEARNRLCLAAGLYCGLGLMVQSYLTMIGIGMGLCLAFLFVDFNSWSRFLFCSVMLALPQVVWLATGTAMKTSAFLHWNFGWDKPEHEDIITFWLQNTGLFLPMLLAAIYYDRDTRRRRFYAPFVLCFIGPNVLRMAPWVWDNIKVLLPWFVMSAPFVAHLLADCSRQRRGGLMTAGVLTMLLCVSGGLDVWRVWSRADEAEIFGGDQVRFARKVITLVAQPAVFLNVPSWNTPVYLVGGRMLEAFQGHLWTRGIEDHGRPDDIRKMYEGDPNALELLGSYGVDYVEITPEERDEYKDRLDEGFFSRYPKLIDWRGYALYYVSGPTH